MKTPESTIQRIIKNAALSLFIYSLPILLMFVTFYVKGEKPWLKKPAKENTISQQKNK